MIKIKDTEIEFKITARVEMMFENMVYEIAKGRESGIAPQTSTLIYIFCVCSANYPDANITFEDVIDAYDEQPQMIMELNEALQERKKRQEDLLAQYNEDKEAKKKVIS